LAKAERIFEVQLQVECGSKLFKSSRRKVIVSELAILPPCGRLREIYTDLRVVMGRFWDMLVVRVVGNEEESNDPSSKEMAKPIAWSVR
jgi:hypothetical protein